MKMTSRIALVAAAATLFGAYSANAADLGGGCCADLEERLAELEATTVRKGNRVVTLQVYGQVSRGILSYDAESIAHLGGVDIELDEVVAASGGLISRGDEKSDTRLISEDGSNFGFVGSASISPGWTAGYKIEYDVVDEQGASPEVKQNHLWIESEQLGRVTLGQASTATDGIAHIVLANTYSDSGAFQGDLYSAINSLSVDLAPLLIANAKLASYTDFDGVRGDVLRYDSPSIAGFILSASWSDDLSGSNPEEDYWDVTLRYSGEFNAFRVAAGIGYTDDHSNNETIQGSASIMHVPSGLFAAFSAGSQERAPISAFGLEFDQDRDYWYVTAGVEKTFLPYGKTTIYGEYGEYSGAAGVLVDASLDFFSGGAVVDANLELDGDETMWGAGIVQSIDSAALDIYLQYRHVEGEIGDSNLGFSSEFDTVVLGTTIKF